MKKILLVNKSFELGGIQSSMVNMANELSKYYEVYLFLYNPEGVMKERLSENVRVLETSWRFRCLGMSIKDVLRTKKIKMIIFRVFATVWAKLFNNELPISKAMKHHGELGEYDLAIAYHQEQRKKSVVSGFTRVVDRLVKAKTKAAWLHFDNSTIDLDSEYNNPFYAKMDKIVCVSKSLMENFAAMYPDLGSKMDYCYNFMLYDVIKEKSLAPQEIPYPEDKFICFSACRLTEEKALVRGIDSVSSILKAHPEVVWYIAGDGSERSDIEDVIKKRGLEAQIKLIGNQPNPYPYMKNAKLTMNVSYHEAAPMIFFESKSLGTPVFATRTLSAEELLSDRIDSFICDNSADGIRDLFNFVIENKELVEDAALRLKSSNASNDASISKIKDLTDNSTF